MLRTAGNTIRFGHLAEAAFGIGVFVFREEPEAEGNRRAVEELAGEGVHVVAQLIGSEPELGLEAKVGSGVGGFAGCFACHVDF